MWVFLTPFNFSYFIFSILFLKLWLRIKPKTNQKKSYNTSAQIIDLLAHTIHFCPALSRVVQPHQVFVQHPNQ